MPPGVIAVFQNIIPTMSRACLRTLANAMRTEYETIGGRGVAQIDAPDLAMGGYIVPRC